jgi:hypothetical protein
MKMELGIVDQRSLRGTRFTRPCATLAALLTLAGRADVTPSDLHSRVRIT